MPIHFGQMTLQTNDPSDKWPSGQVNCPPTQQLFPSLRDSHRICSFPSSSYHCSCLWHLIQPQQLQLSPSPSSSLSQHPRTENSGIISANTSPPGLLLVPRHRCSTLGRLAFSIAGPMAWNALPDDLRDPSLIAVIFRKRLKTHLFRNALGHVVH